MEDTDEPTQNQIRNAVRTGVTDAGRSFLSTVFGTILAVFSLLVGLHTLRLAFAGIGVSIIVFGSGVLVIGTSLYLLYLLHWR
jgi:hypothetical protein